MNIDEHIEVGFYVAKLNIKIKELEEENKKLNDVNEYLAHLYNRQGININYLTDSIDNLKEENKKLKEDIEILSKELNRLYCERYGTDKLMN